MSTSWKLSAIDLGGGGWVLTQILSLHVISSLDSPADGLEATAILEKAPPEFGWVKLENSTGVLFEGMVDEQILECTARGLVLELNARSLGALLLDNESLPMVYEHCRLTDLARRCLTPYGVFGLKIPATPAVSSFTVAKGWSDWEALSRFCRRTLGTAPHLDRSLQLRVDTQPQRFHTVSNQQPGGLHYRRFRWKDDRSQVVSKVCLRDRDGYYSTAVTNPEAEKLGVRRKRYLIPGSEYANEPAQDADRVIKSSMARRRVMTLELPELLELWPGDGILLPDGAFPMGNMTVSQLEWRIGEKGIWTALELCDPQYAGHLGD